MRIFYSWQLDTARKANKDFIHDALNDAIQKIRDETELDLPDRQDVHLDQDTQGVMGSPTIAQVILDKISKTDVFIADVSLVGETINGKKQINSNVAIELGYAYGVLGDHAILKIMNTSFGKPEDLPFDLRGRRFPVRYNLSEHADSCVQANERVALSGELYSILKQYSEKIKETSVQSVAHEEVNSVKVRGRFWNSDDLLVPESRPYRRPDITDDTTRLFHFRCIPAQAKEPIGVVEANDLAADLPPLFHMTGYSPARNEWGAVSFDLDHTSRQVSSMTQVFRNREVWSIDLYHANVNNAIDDDRDGPMWAVPLENAMRSYKKSIDQIRRHLPGMGYDEDYYMEFGLSSARGLRLATRNRLSDPILVDEVYVRVKANKDLQTKEFLQSFLERLVDEVGWAGVPESIFE